MVNEGENPFTTRPNASTPIIIGKILLIVVSFNALCGVVLVVLSRNRNQQSSFGKGIFGTEIRFSAPLKIDTVNGEIRR